MVLFRRNQRIPSNLRGKVAVPTKERHRSLYIFSVSISMNVTFFLQVNTRMVTARKDAMNEEKRSKAKRFDWRVAELPCGVAGC